MTTTPASTLRASVTAEAAGALPGDAVQVLVDGADTPITANGLADYTPTPGDRLLVQRVGGLVEVLQFLSRGTVPYIDQAALDAVAAEAAAAQQAAAAAQTSANSAEAAATSAQQSANTADANATQAQTTANTADTAANTAQTTATAAQTAAAAAQTKASTADTAASTAQTAATAADAAAVTAQTAANTANTAAAAAQTKANTATTNAATAQTQADTAFQRAETAQSAANTAQTAAATADGKAVAAQTSATAAGTAAAAAQSTANTADTNATAAQTTANTADTAAGAAQSTANTASTAAAAAQTSANSANTAATAAQTSANTADAKAVTAQTAANTADAAAVAAQTSANTADTAANTANTAAAAAQTKANTATTAASTADGKAVAAQNTANTAQSAAAAAQTTANTADTNAAAAQTKANTADTNALNAAGIAAAKGTVYHTSAAPAGDALGLWLDPNNGNVAKVWNGSTWVATQDTGIAAAAAAAATANTAAVAAASAASTADGKAVAAQTSANTANTNAATAQTKANSADTAAVAAQSTANTANTAAATAQTKANSADTNATNAASAASTADGKAVAAQNTANTANTAAATAQTKANSASTAAAAAQTSANTANTAATAAQSAATTADGKAVAAQTSANTADAAAATAQTAAQTLSAAAQAAATTAAAADATAKATAAQAAAVAASKTETGRLSAKTGKTWTQDTAPVPTATYRWTGTRGKSTSEKVVGGVVAATNLSKNPSYEFILPSPNNYRLAPAIQSDERVYVGKWSVKAYRSPEQYGVNQGLPSLYAFGNLAWNAAGASDASAGKTYTVSTYLYADSASYSWVLLADYRDASGTITTGFSSEQNSAPVGTWSRPSFTFTPPAGTVTTSFSFVGTVGADFADDDVAYLDAVMVNEGSEPIDYFDGDTAEFGNDQWIDTANGNKLKVWDNPTLAWVDASDEAIATAQTSANTAGTAAATAQTKAVAAAASAATATAAANTAASTAAAANTAASTAATAASTADAKAVTAQNAANTADAAAATAQTAANTANTAAATAQTKANTADAAAATAQTAATTADGKAVTAQTAANTANTAAATAQTKANTATTNAATADGKAVAAQTSANTANAAAATAQTAAENAYSRWAPTGVTTINGGQITTDSITAAQVAAHTITVDELDTDVLSAGFVLTGRLQVGQAYLDANEGLVIPQPDGGSINLPVDGSAATITAHLIGSSLDVTDDITLNGLAQERGTFQLTAGITTPTTPPAVIHQWPNRVTGLAGQYASIYHGLVESLTNSGNYVTAMSFFGGSVNEFSKTTDAAFGYGPMNWGTTLQPSGGITTLGGYYYVLGTAYGNTLGHTDGDWYVYKLDTGFNKVAEFLVTEGQYVSATPTIGNDGTNLLVAFCNASSQTQVRTYSVGGAILGNLAPNMPSTKYNLGGIYAGNADFGVSRVIISTVGGTQYVFDSGMANRIPASEFWRAGNSRVSGLLWDGTRFRHLDDTGSLWDYATRPVAQNVDVGYTWWDGNGTTHETALSAKASYTWPVRSWLSIANPPAPDVGSSNVDAANQSRSYVGPSGGTVRLQMQLNVGVRAYAMETLNIASSTPPLSNGFASAGSPAGIFESAAADSDGPLVKFGGDGSARLNNVTVTGKVFSPSVPDVQIGTSTINLTTATPYGYVDVTFPRPFASLPVVVAMANGTNATDYLAAQSNLTATSVRLWLTSISAAKRSQTIQVTWFAAVESV